MRYPSLWFVEHQKFIPDRTRILQNIHEYMKFSYDFIVSWCPFLELKVAESGYARWESTRRSAWPQCCYQVWHTVWPRERCHPWCHCLLSVSHHADAPGVWVSLMKGTSSLETRMPTWQTLPDFPSSFLLFLYSSKTKRITIQVVSCQIVARVVHASSCGKLRMLNR